MSVSRSLFFIFYHERLWLKRRHIITKHHIPVDLLGQRVCFVIASLERKRYYVTFTALYSLLSNLNKHGWRPTGRGL